MCKSSQTVRYRAYAEDHLSARISSSSLSITDRHHVWWPGGCLMSIKGAAVSSIKYSYSALCRVTTVPAAHPPYTTYRISVHPSP